LSECFKKWHNLVPDAEHLGGAHAIAMAHFQDALDVDAADFIEGQRTPGSIGG
jgi:hypothetical protein